MYQSYSSYTRRKEFFLQQLISIAGGSRMGSLEFYLARWWKMQGKGLFLIVLCVMVKVAVWFSEGSLPHMVYLVHEMWQLDSCVCVSVCVLNCHVNK